MKSVELFTGAGGLAQGISNAGFSHQAAIERDKDACLTIRVNQQRSISAVADWPIFETDVTQFDFTTLQAKGEIDLLAGGPPCQPFSQGGKHQGWDDSRDMFPHFFRAVRDLKPKAILIENVKGLLRSSFAKYVEYILLQLTYPEILSKPGVSWLDHLSLLERHHTIGRHNGLSYRIVFRNINAADYGIPQKRERVFIVGFRADLGIEWSFPPPTHSWSTLLWEQWVTGDYWERHQVSHSQRPDLANKLADRIHNLQSSLFPPLSKPWRTVRDAISDLPLPESQASTCTILNHVLIPGARKYPGHTGSPLDEPAKTLKAGVHGVPGGENMLAFPTGEVRYFTVREAARLQTFPDEYLFPHCWTQTMRQLGNAVPVSLAQVIATSMRSQLLKLSPTHVRNI